MENKNKKQVGGANSSLDHLFGPKESSSSQGVFGSIFSPPSQGMGRDGGMNLENQVGHKYGNYPESMAGKKGESSGTNKKEKNSVYQNETSEPCYFSSSIHYGGRENYSPRTNSSQSHHPFKKEGGGEDPSGNNPSSASRGNWWEGMTTMTYCIPAELRYIIDTARSYI